MPEPSTVVSLSGPAGFLAIWSTVGAVDETDYLHWLTREHVAERLGVAGFLSCSVYRLVGPERRYFICYRLSSAGVVGSADYLARLNDPTTWSRRIMPKLGSFVRGGGRILAQAGMGRGAWCAAIEVDPRQLPDPEGLVARLRILDRVTSVSLLVTDQEATSIPTNEKGIRSGDRSFEALLVIEGLDGESVRQAVATAGFASDGALYQLVFAA